MLDATLTVQVPLHLTADDQPEPGSRSPVLIGLHGFGMTGPAMMTFLKKLAPPGFFLISLQGPHSTFVPGTETGADRQVGFHWGVTPLAEEVRATHRASLEAAMSWAVEHDADPDRVSLAAFSQPCSLNYRVASSPPGGRPFRALVAISGGVPGDWRSSDAATPDSRQTAALHVSARQDPFYPLDRISDYQERLSPRFGRVRHSLYDGGHRIPSGSLDEIRAFLAANG
jgi:predicted esterase